MRGSRIAFLCLVIWLMISCSQSSTEKPIFTVSDITPLTSNTSILPIQTVTPTFFFYSSAIPSTLIVNTFTPTPVPSPTPSPTPPPEVMLFPRFEISGHLPMNAVVTGTIVLSGNYIFQFNPPDRNFEADSYFLNMKTGEKIIFSPKGDRSLMNFAVSLDQQWMAIEKLNRDPVPLSIIIMTAKGQTYTTITEERDWGGYEWLDNNQLIIDRNIRKEEGNSEKGFAGYYSLFLLNPFTGQRKELLPDYPGIFSYDPLYTWSHNMIFNSTLTRVVYPNRKSVPSIILWDIQAGKEIIRFDFGESPKWSPNGKRMAWLVDVGPDYRNPWYQAQEFFIVNQDGQITRLTHMTDYLHYVSIGSYSWSPDGHYIAFWMTTGKNNPIQLAVVDTFTSQVIVYPINANFSTIFGPNYLVLTNDTAPIWSPDGEQLLIVTYDPSDKTHNLVVLVDIVKNYAAMIIENMIPVGWLKGP